jgi:hypothetical protein
MKTRPHIPSRSRKRAMISPLLTLLEDCPVHPGRAVPSPFCRGAVLLMVLIILCPSLLKLPTRGTIILRAWGGNKRVAWRQRSDCILV